MVIMVLSYELLYLQIFNVRDLYIPDKNPCETYVVLVQVFMWF